MNYEALNINTLNLRDSLPLNMLSQLRLYDMPRQGVGDVLD